MSARTQPHFISKTAWFFVNPGSIDFVVEARSELGLHLKTTVTRISKRELLKACPDLRRVKQKGKGNP